MRAELGEDEWRVAERLAAARARLLVIGRDSEGAETVELIHEALITSWDKLEGRPAACWWRARTCSVT
ncbi:hypothetical protein ACLB9X_34160 [Streptomyces sp. 5K101]|uniref:nSTAND1 domain-containing NTPase n=1 Tax=Streptomyces sp. 5K101 TaxID=3390037 RepID=UPI0039762256